MMLVGEIVQQIRGVTYKKSQARTKACEGYKPVLRAGNISSSRIINSDLVYVPESLIKKERLLKYGDILIAASSGSLSVVGKAAMLEADMDAGFGAFCKVLRPNTAIVHPRYFRHFFETPYYKRTISHFAEGANINNLKTEHFDKLEIPLPPLAEQKKIAAILDAADRLRQKDAQLIAKYNALSQSLFLDMFGDPVTNPMGWKKKEFGTFIDVLTDYHANGSYEVLKKNVTLTKMEDYALMVRTTDLEHRNFTEDVVYISQNAYEYLSKSKVYGGEIIISKIGSAGKVFLMPYLNKPVSLGMNAFLLRFNETLNNIFVYYLLTSKFGEREIGKRIKGAVTKTIRKDALREISIVTPPIELQNKFAERIQHIEAQKQQAQAALQKSDDLFNSLLQRAFKGELTQENEVSHA